MFLNALATTNGWPRGTLSAGIGVGVVSAGLATPLVGLLIDRFGVRVPIAIGVACLGAGFGSLAAMSEPWHFVAANVLLGPGFAGVAMLPITIAVTVRVPDRTALALGLVSAGASLGALAARPDAAGADRRAGLARDLRVRSASPSCSCRSRCWRRCRRGGCNAALRATRRWRSRRPSICAANCAGRACSRSPRCSSCRAS